MFGASWRGCFDAKQNHARLVTGACMPRTTPISGESRIWNAGLIRRVELKAIGRIVMRGLVLIGVVLALLGAAALVFGQIGYTDTQPVLKAGPLQIDKTETHSVSIPTIGGVALLIAGLGFVFVGMRRK